MSQETPSPSVQPSSTQCSPGVESRRAEFTRIARENEAGLLRAARRMCNGNDDMSQDLVQDTLVRAYEAHLNGLFDGANPRPWLLRILTNLFINDFRRRRKWDSGVTVDDITRSGESGPPQTHVANANLPGSEMLANTLDEDLERGLNSLSDPLRLCVLLVDVEGLDYAQAAATLNVPIGTVRSRLSRARMLLHDFLRDCALKKGWLPKR